EGIVTRRDLEKANHHGLGHAPVKAYMTTNVYTVNPNTTEEEIEQLIIERNIGRIPVVENEKLLGIVSRTNIIEVMHSKKSIKNIKTDMQEQLNETIFDLLQDISKSAEEAGQSVYLIGGIVRDIILKQPNDDIDIVVEGNGITFAKKLYADYGGELILHETFN